MNNRNTPESSGIISLVFVILKLVVVINGSYEQAHSCGDLIGLIYDTIYITFILDIFVCVFFLSAYILNLAVLLGIAGILQLTSIVFICIPWGQFPHETVLFYPTFYTGPNNCTQEYTLANGVYKVESFIVMFSFSVFAVVCIIIILCTPCIMYSRSRLFKRI